jgi:hypothetical protein
MFCYSSTITSHCTFVAAASQLACYFTATRGADTEILLHELLQQLQYTQLPYLHAIVLDCDSILYWLTFT